MVTMMPTPAASRARDDAVEVGGELREVEVAVVVDEHHVWLSSRPCPSGVSFFGFAFFGLGARLFAASASAST